MPFDTPRLSRTPSPFPPLCPRRATLILFLLHPSLNLEISLFERLERAGHPVHMLTVQYRMHPEIRAFPSGGWATPVRLVFGWTDLPFSELYFLVLVFSAFLRSEKSEWRVSFVQYPRAKI